MGELSSYYSKNMPLWQLANFYGAEIDPNDNEQQIHCLYPEHGTGDVHKSARYYGYSRDNDETEASIYCHKCHKRRTSLWLAHAVQHAKEEMSLHDTLVWLENTFKVPFPAEMVLDKDVDELVSLDPAGEPRVIALDRLMEEAVAVRELRGKIPHQDYLDRIYAIAESRL